MFFHTQTEPFTWLTSDDELSEVGNSGTSGRQGDAAIEVLLSALCLHLEGCHQPLMAQPRQQGCVKHHAVSPLTVRKTAHRGKSAMSTPATCVYWKSIEVIKNGQQAEKQTRRQRRFGICYMGGQDNEDVVNITGNKSVEAGDTGLPGGCFVHRGLAGASAALCVLMHLRSRQTGNWLSQWRRKSEASVQKELFQVRDTICAALSKYKQII